MVYVSKVKGGCFGEADKKRYYVQVEFIDDPRQDDGYSYQDICKKVKGELGRQVGTLCEVKLLNNNVGIQINFAGSANLNKIGEILANIFNKQDGLCKTDNDEKYKFENLSNQNDIKEILSPFVYEFIRGRK